MPNKQGKNRYRAANGRYTSLDPDSISTHNSSPVLSDLGTARVTTLTAPKLDINAILGIVPTTAPIENIAGPSHTSPTNQGTPSVPPSPPQPIERRRRTTSDTYRRRRTTSDPTFLRQLNDFGLVFPETAAFAERQPSPIAESSATSKPSPRQESIATPNHQKQRREEYRVREESDIYNASPKASPQHNSPRNIGSDDARPGTQRFSTNINKMASPMLSQNLSQSSYGNDARYSKAQWKRDAATIVEIGEELTNNGFPHLEGILTTGDIATAKTLLRVVDANTRQQLQAKALENIHSQHSSAAEAASFTRFLERFRKGPPEDEAIDTASDISRYGKENAGRNGRQSRAASRTSLPRGNVQQNTGRQSKTGFQSYNTSGAPPDDDDNGDSSDDEYDRYRRFKEFERREKQRQTGTTSRHRQRSGEDEGHQNNDGALFHGVKRLRVDEVGTFDGTPDTPSAVAYGKRLTMLAGMYGERPVLATLPLCMKGRAATWFDGLEDEVATLMTESIEEWKIQLVRRFHTNPSQALVKADSMQHRFDDETEMDVREYISRKYGLYREAGETNQDNIVRRIHDGLDPTLAAAVPLRGANNTMNDFQAKVYAAEHQARQQYKQLKTRLDIIEQQNQDMKKLVSAKQPQVQYAIPANTRYQNKQNSFDNFNDDRFSRFNRNKPEEPSKVSFKEVTEVETIPSARRLTGSKQTEVTPQNQTGTTDSSSAAPYQRQYNGRGNNWSNNGNNWSNNGNNWGNNSWRSRNNYRNNNSNGNGFTPRQVRAFIVDTDDGEKEYVMVDRDTYEQYQEEHQTNAFIVGTDQDTNDRITPDSPPPGEEGNFQAGR